MTDKEKALIDELFKSDIETLIEKYSKEKEDDIYYAFEDAFYLYVELRNDDELTLETLKAREKNWIRRCAKELIENEEYANIQSYSENDYSFTRFSDLLSPTLKNAVVPKVKKIQ